MVKIPDRIGHGEGGGRLPKLAGILRQIADQLEGAEETIGDLETLDTEEKETVVGAINENNGRIDGNENNIGDLSQLNTVAKDNLVAAINELEAQIGS